jgi:hypothetical protein
MSEHKEQLDLFQDKEKRNHLISFDPVVEAYRLVSDTFDYYKWVTDLPSIPTYKGWNVTPLPPFGMATSRLRVGYKDSPCNVSVYFDACNRLGYMSEPYWEIFPTSDGDARRFLLGDEKRMARYIQASLRSQRVNHTLYRLKAFFKNIFK